MFKTLALSTQTCEPFISLMWLRHSLCSFHLLSVTHIDESHQKFQRFYLFENYVFEVCLLLYSKNTSFLGTLNFAVGQYFFLISERSILAFSEEATVTSARKLFLSCYST